MYLKNFMHAFKRLFDFYKRKRDALIKRIKSVELTHFPAIIYCRSHRRATQHSIRLLTNATLMDALLTYHTSTYKHKRKQIHIFFILLLLSICLGPFHYFVNMIRFLLRARTRSIYFYYERCPT